MWLLVLVFLLQNLDCHVIDSGVVKHDNTAVRTRLDMEGLIPAILVVDTAEVVAYCLHCHVEFVCDAVCRAIGQTVFESAKLSERDGLAPLLPMRD